jgi:amidophosphoribosyltransferase
MYGCKYLNFSRSVSDNELIARRAIRELESIAADQEIPAGVLAEYAESSTEKHAKMVDLIKDRLGFDSLRYQSLEDVIRATEVDSCKLCTYCWNGKE